MKCLPFGDNAPGKKFAAIVVALSRSPKAIDSPLGAGTELLHIHGRERYSHLGGPNMMFGVDAGCVLESGIPRRIVKRVPGLVDFQVNPLIVRSNFKLKIVIHAFGLRIQEDFDNVAFSAEPGQVSEPFRTQFGWHIVLVRERRPAGVPSFDDVASQLQNRILREKQEHDIGEKMAALRGRDHAR